MAAAVTSLVGAVLLFIRPVELRVAQLLGANARPPTAEESARIERAARAGPASARASGASG